jgi:hypothetical protein
MGALVMEAVRTSETSAYCNETARRYIPEGCYLHTRHRENLKFHLLCIYCLVDTAVFSALPYFRKYTIAWRLCTAYLFPCTFDSFDLFLWTFLRKVVPLFGRSDFILL